MGVQCIVRLEDADADLNAAESRGFAGDVSATIKVGRIFRHSRELKAYNGFVMVLREPGEFQGAFLESLEELVFVVGRGGKISWANSQSKLLGYEPEELIGSRLDALLTGSSASNKLKATLRLRDLEVSRRVGLRNKRGKQQDFVLTFWGPASFLTKGDKLYLFSTASKKELNDELRKVKALFFRTLENLNDAILISDPKSRVIQFANSAAAKIFGYSKSELVGKTTGFLQIKQEGFKAFIKKDGDASEPMRVLEMDYELRRKSGERIHATHKQVAVFNGGAKAENVVSVIQDITRFSEREQRETEKANYLQFIINASPLVLFAVNRYGIFTSFSMGQNLPAPLLNPGDVVGRAVSVIKGVRLKLPDGEKTSVRQAMRRVFAGERVKLFGLFADRTYEVWLYPYPSDKDAKLLIGLSFDITEKVRAEEEMVEGAKNIRELSNLLSSAQEDERNRLSGELHDHVGQQLVLINLALSQANMNALSDPEAAQANIKHAIALVKEAGTAVDQIVSALHPSFVASFGLFDSLKWYAKYIEQFNLVKVRFKGSRSAPQLSAEEELAIYRIVQEAMNNCLKHADASLINIRLNLKKKNINLTIEDNGVGFNPNDPKALQRWGIFGMRERSMSIGAEFEISSALGNGTRVTVIRER